MRAEHWRADSRTLDPRPTSLASRQVVDLEPGLDLFLVRDDLWEGRPLPDLASHRDLYRPFNVQRDGAMRAEQQAPRAGR